MVEIRQDSPIEARNRSARTVRYDPSAPDVSFECFTLDDLRDRVRPAELDDLQRIHFDLVIACTRGHGMHEVDFETTTINTNRWLHIRPGQVHRWMLGNYDADLLLLAPLDRSPHWQPGPRVIELNDDQLHDIAPLLDLAGHPRRTNIGTATLQTMRDLIVRWLALDQPDVDNTDPLWDAFRRLLDREVIESRNVEHYASRLGCSPRTLARCCERAGAPSPKRLIDDALFLEAQRRLAFPGTTVTRTSIALGFDEVTNFTKFFKRLAGQTPTEWQIGRPDNLIGRR